MSMDTCYPCLRSVQGEGRGEGLVTKPKILLSPFLSEKGWRRVFFSCYSAKPSPHPSPKGRGRYQLLGILRESLALHKTWRIMQRIVLKRGGWKWRQSTYFLDASSRNCWAPVQLMRWRNAVFHGERHCARQTHSGILRSRPPAWCV